MERNVLLIIIISLIAFGCRSSTKSSDIISTDEDSVNQILLNKPKVTTQKIYQQSLDTIYNDMNICQTLLIELIKRSSYNQEAKKMNFSIIVDLVDDSVATLELSILNEERKESVPLGWLELDLRQHILRDVTVDPDSPITLSIDTAILSQVLKKCSFGNVR